MCAETNVVDCEQIEIETDFKKRFSAKNEEKAKSEDTGEIRFFGVRVLVTHLLPACEKIDRIFGSGSEAIIHHMRFESGYSLFDNMINCNSSKSLEELLQSLIEVQPRAGWGKLSIRIIRTDPPMVDIQVKNPPVKTLRGSQKHLIGSFWAGVFSKYFNRQLTCKNFGYNADKDEFSCSITI